MSANLVISVDNISKKYLLHQGNGNADGLRHVVEATLKAPLSWLRRFGRSRDTHAEHDEFWALRNVSLEVKRGEVLGLIGRNGAGKSTLLKILSRITDPTDGCVRIRGRVTSLLEVGTGFHPELTGRENVYLNGSILGMTKAEVRRRFDEIVAFSEVERFLDTPVKRYSSGMYVRLAFAVAAHLEAETLIIDEVLAVGDAAFQRKCLGKMQSVSRSGKTVLFVSHNMEAVVGLCDRAVLLQSGSLQSEGAPSDVVAAYLSLNQDEGRFVPVPEKRTGDQRVSVVDFSVEPRFPATGAGVRFVFRLRRRIDVPRDIEAHVEVNVLTERDLRVMKVDSKDMGVTFSVGRDGLEVVAHVNRLALVPGAYRLNLWVGMGAMGFDWIREAYVLRVMPGGFVDGVTVPRGNYPIASPASWQASAGSAPPS